MFWWSNLDSCYWREVSDSSIDHLKTIKIDACTCVEGGFLDDSSYVEKDAPSGTFMSKKGLSHWHFLCISPNSERLVSIYLAQSDVLINKHVDHIENHYSS